MLNLASTRIMQTAGPVDSETISIPTVQAEMAQTAAGPLVQFIP